MDKLAILGRLREISARMAEQARSGDWEVLPELQFMSDAIVTELRGIGGLGLGEKNTAQAALLTEEILANFEVVQEVIHPWLEQVKPFLSTLSSARS